VKLAKIGKSTTRRWSNWTGLSFLVVSASLLGCRYGHRNDVILSSESNPSHSLRATVVRRQYLLDNGMEDASATTYLLVDKDGGWPTYKNGQDFVQKTIVMRPSQCGPLKTIWINDHSLKVICVRCGLSRAVSENI
jgi:hypothetical protein